MAVRMIGAAPTALNGDALCIRCQAEFKSCICDCQRSEEKSQWVAIRQVDLQYFRSFNKR